MFEGTSVIKLDGNGSILYSVPFSTLPGVLTGAGRAVIDSQGNCYVASGGTINPTPGAFQSSPKLLAPAQFVMKFDPAGKTLYATYLGGSSTDSPAGLAVDSDGNAYITGATNSNDFPTLHAVQPVLAGQEDVFIAVLNPTGTALIYSTYWGGSANDGGRSIAVDGGKNAYITGSTSSTDFPTVSPLQSTLAGSVINAFVIKLDPSGTPVYSTYLGGDASSVGTAAIAADAAGNAYVTGSSLRWRV